MLPTEAPSRRTGSCEIPVACISSTAEVTVASGLTVVSCRGPAGAQQVAHRVRPGWGSQVEPVLGQPGVVEELAQIIAPGVGAEGDDQVVGAEPAGEPKGRRDGRAARAADEDPLLAGQLPGGVERLGVADADPLVDHLAVERPGHEVLADALDLPRIGASLPRGSSPPDRRR